MNKTASKTFAFFIPITVICTVIRYLQLVSGIDYNTGFYYNHIGILGSLFYIVLGAGGLGLIIFSVWDKNSRNNFYVKRISKIDENETLIIAVMFLITGAVSVYTLVMQVINNENGVNIIISLIGAAGFLSEGLLLCRKKRVTHSAGYLLLILAVYFAAQVITGFMEHLVITRMSEYLVLLMIGICLVFFFLSLGRVFSRNEGNGARLRTSVFGFSACAMIFSETASKLVFWITSSDTMRNYLMSDGVKFVMPDMVVVAEGILVFALLFVMLKTPFKKNDDEK